MSLLLAQNLEASYGSVKILNGCSIDVEKGQLAVIVGPNGAGKSTLMKVLLGIVKPTKGIILLNNKDITKLNTQQKIIQGMSFMPQNNNIFYSMTVEENLQMGAFLSKDNIEEQLIKIYKLFPILDKKRKQLANQLSGGQRQQVGFGRALMSNPCVLLLDEPTAGVSPLVIGDIFDSIVKIISDDIGILMVEQNAKRSLNIADKGFVLVNGCNEYSGTGRELLADKQVCKRFLGG